MSQPRPWPLAWAALLLSAALAPVGQAASVRAAVAANFAPTLDALADEFGARSGHRVVVIAGSTGKLYAQIKNGAPFDVYFAADVERPLRLEKEGEGVAGTRFTYALGRLALWSRDPGRVDGTSRALRAGDFARLAIANPVTAPYGLAARQTLERLGLWTALESALVRGENIAQTFQFVASGNAELGFVALAQLQARADLGGSRWLVPAEMHEPIAQQAILLRGAREPAAARAFLDYVRAPATLAAIAGFGYDRPAD